jgi:hypothetical protein
MDSEITIAAAPDRIGPQRLHFLRDDADISFLSAQIAEPVVAEAVIKMTKQDDVVLQREIRAPSAAASKTASATATESTSAATSEAAAPHHARSATSTRHARETGPSAR